MYKLDDIIAYSSQGVCKVVEISTKEFAGQQMEYYILKPVFDSRSTVSVPVSNAKLTSRMRQIMTREEADALIDSIADAEYIWIDDDNKRREAYNALLTEGDPSRIAALFKTLILRRKELEALSRKLRTADDGFLRQSEKLLCCECSYAGCGEQSAIRERLLSTLL